MKYNIRICSCGRIHFVENSLIDEAIKKSKELAIICGGCGNADVIGADYQTDEDNHSVYVMYSYDPTLNDTKYDITEHIDKFHKVIIDPGKRVMMKTGYYATHYNGGIFTDMSWPLWDFMNKTPSAFTTEEVAQTVKKHRQDMQTANMNLLVRSLTEEEAKSLSSYYIEGLDWSGTKYERKW